VTGWVLSVFVVVAAAGLWSIVSVQHLILKQTRELFRLLAQVRSEARGSGVSCAEAKGAETK